MTNQDERRPDVAWYVWGCIWAGALWLGFISSWLGFISSELSTISRTLRAIEMHMETMR